jgi:hypothetical protein
MNHEARLRGLKEISDMSASEIVNKVWNYAHVLAVVRKKSCSLRYQAIFMV